LTVIDRLTRPVSRRQVVAAGAALFGSVIVVACSQPAAPPTSAPTQAVAPTSAPAAPPTVAPAPTIAPTTAPAAAPTTAPTAAPAKATPDLAYLNHDMVFPFAQAGAIDPLDDYLSSIAPNLVADYSPAVINGLKAGGKLRMLPILSGAVCGLFNKELYQQIGL